MSKMRLSTAIRLGAMMKPQGRRRLNNEGTTCALGAALDAVGFEWGESDIGGYGALRQHFPALWDCEVMVDGIEVTLLRAVWTMNDVLGLSRERIADFVEEQEVAMGLLTQSDDEEDDDSPSPSPEPLPVAAAA